MKKQTILALAMSLGLTSTALAQGTTAFTWQGRLDDAGQPASGNYDLRFTIYDSLSGGTALGTNSLPAAAVSNGLFTATLDFGASVFDGSARWLELSVRTNGAAAFTTLAPRQPVTPTPYAIRAANFSGAVAEAQLPANVTSGAAAANNAASANTPGALVKRDGSGNFAAGTVTANLAGNAATATSAGNFTGALAGDVTGTQGATAVAAVGGQSAANVASGAAAANASTAANTANAIVKRDASGNFSAGTITAASVGGSGAALTGLNASQLASGTVADARLSGNVALLNANNAFTGSNQVVGVLTATNAGNLLSGAFTGNLTGNISGNAATATSAGSFTGALAGDVTGTQAATTVAAVGGQSAANVASGAAAANASTAANAANTIVKRDASGNFSAGAITAASVGGSGAALTGLNASQLASGTVADARLSANVALLNANNAFAGSNRLAGVLTATNEGNVLNGAFTGNLAGNVTGNVSGSAATATTAGSFTGPLAGDVTGTQGATVVGSVGGQTAANVASGAASANAATSANTANTLVKRDASGNFSAGSITAGSVSGNGAGLTNLNASQLASGTVADARLSGNVALLNANNAFTGSNRLAGVLVATNTANVLSGTFAGNLTGNVVGNVQGNVTGAASSATNFSGLLAGDVTGPQGATVVGSVGGQSAANVASGAASANAATSANTANTLVKRDASGNFSAGAITAGSVSGNGAGLTNLNASQLASGTVADARLSGNVALLSANNAFTGSNRVAGVLVATNTGNLLSGAFTGSLAGNVVGNLQGNVIGAASVATNFTGLLAGDVAGPQGATVVGSVGGQTAANVASGAASANAATSANTPDTIVKRDGSGNFAAGTITADSVSAGTLSGDGSGITNLNGANLVAGTVAAAQIAAGAVGSNQLAPGAAVANLQASGQSGVPSGGLILSTNASDATLTAAGYVKLGEIVLQNDTWTQRSSPPVPGRGYFAAVWTGTEFIFWGGYDKSSDRNDGARYNPATDAWVAITTTGAPSARSSTEAVWSGTEMLVWGGYANVANGGRYNPALNTWTSMATSGQPAGRADPGLVWTGSRMIVWGGFVGGSGPSFGDGAQYDPVANTWSPISSTGAPSARHAHAILWTGTQMLVWGGRPGGWEDVAPVTLSDGARYNPIANTWSAISTNGSPSRRYASTAAWTGQEMLIWGGGCNHEPWPTGGGRYNPISDTWQPITSIGAPVAREFHQMTKGVWTGKQLVIWGGSASTELNSGGCYDPVLDAWTPTSQSPCPSPRYAYRAIWTGTQVILYGGATSVSSSVAFNDTWSYDPTRRVAYLYQRP